MGPTIRTADSHVLVDDGTAAENTAECATIGTAAKREEKVPLSVYLRSRPVQQVRNAQPKLRKLKRRKQPTVNNRQRESVADAILRRYKRGLVSRGAAESAASMKALCTAVARVKASTT